MELLKDGADRILPTQQEGHLAGRRSNVPVSGTDLPERSAGVPVHSFLEARCIPPASAEGKAYGAV